MQCQANIFLTLHAALFTLHTCTSHFTLHTSCHLGSCELFSSQLISSHPISSHMSSKKVLLNCFHLTRALINLSHLLEVVLNSSQLFCTPENSYCQREVSCTKKTFGAESYCTQTLGTQMHVDRKAIRNTLYYTACTKHFPVLLLLCTTKLAQSTSQYYFVLQSLHKALLSTTLSKEV